MKPRASKWWNAREIFLAFYLLLTTTATYLIFADLSDQAMEAKASGSAKYVAIWGTVYAILVLNAVSTRKILHSRVLPVAFGFIAISAVPYLVYGVDSQNIVRLAAFIMTLLAAAWAAEVFTVTQVFDFWYKISIPITVIHLAMYPLLIKYTTIYDPLGRSNLIGSSSYAGLFAHKNSASTFFAFSIIISICRLISHKGHIKLNSYAVIFMQIIGILISGGVSPVISMSTTMLVVFVLFSFAKGDWSGGCLLLLRSMRCSFWHPI